MVSKPWVFATDFRKVLDIQNPSQAVSRLVAEEKDTIATTDSVGKPHQYIVISEKDAKKLVQYSRKPEAKELMDWLLGDVWPEIERTGTNRTARHRNLCLRCLQSLRI